MTKEEYRALGALPCCVCRAPVKTWLTHAQGLVCGKECGELLKERLKIIDARMAREREEANEKRQVQ